MRSRFLKKFLYGIFYLVIISFIGYGFYNLLQAPPSCSDNLKNGLETGIDCGGDCLPCEILALRDLKVLSAQAIPVGSNQTTLVIQLENSNSAFGATDFNFSVLASEDGSSREIYSDQSFIYPGEIKYLVVPALNFSPPDSISVKITNTRWSALDIFSRVVIQPREIESTTSGSLINVSGIASSNESILLPDVLVNALFYDSTDQLIGASRTIINDLKSFEERSFSVTHPIIPFDESRTRIFITAKRPGVKGILPDR